MPHRILVLSASVGAGHIRAAQAVELALRQVVPEATVKNIDVLELTNAVFRRFYGQAYLDLVNRAPHVLGYFYDYLDRPSRSGKHRSDKLRLALQKLNLIRFMRFLKEQPWDLVINTHFLPAEIIASLRKKGKLSVPQVTVTTDFETHRLWVNQPCERYFTATEEGALYLNSWGVPASDIFPTGIPIHPVFSEPKDRAVCLARHGLADDRPIILQLAGGFGVGPIEKLFQAILEVELPLQVLVVAGRNEKLKTQLQKIRSPDRHRVKVLGFTDQIDELMAVADLVVSKPGGLTTSETLARGAAMVIVNPIPGQESRNSDFLLENGAAIKVNNVATLSYKLTSLLRQPDRLEQLKANARQLGRPQAAFEVVKSALELIIRPQFRHGGHQMKTLRLFLLLLAFAFLLSDMRPVHAQPPGDDPNWRERQLEELQKRLQELDKDIETLRRKHESDKAELEGLMNKHQKMPRSPWLDRWDYGPIFREHRSNLFPHS